jgi:hypothetical protein
MHDASAGQVSAGLLMTCGRTQGEAMQELALDPASGSELPEIVLHRSDFYIRCADTLSDRSRCSVLIRRLYAWRGYRHAPAAATPEVNRVTLQACRGDTVFGTLTIGLDSDAGLAADDLYREEIDAFRRRGASVCEFTRLAIEPEHGTKEVLGAIFHLAYIIGRLRREITDMFIEVNPRHVGFYRRALQFSRIGEARMCERVDAPAVLMHLTAAHVVEQVARFGGHRAISRQSLYPYFFSVQEEQGLTRRLMAASLV